MIQYRDSKMLVALGFMAVGAAALAFRKMQKVPKRPSYLTEKDARDAIAAGEAGPYFCTDAGGYLH